MFLILLLLNSCKSTDYYYEIETHKGDNYNYYTVENINSNKLIIFLQGSGYTSVLGLKNPDNTWNYRTLADPLISMAGDDYNIMIPEKLFFDMGQDYSEDRKALLSADVESITSVYSNSIDNYLDSRNFDSVIIIGSSDGGMFLPKVYSRLRNKDKITKLVNMSGGGGYSQLEEFRILSESPLKMPENYRYVLKQVDNALVDIENNPDSIDKFYFGHPYKRWSSVFKYNPVEYIKEIDIPMLFIHGEKDWSCPVESTRVIEDMNISDNFTFYYYKNMEHGPSNIFQMLRLKKDIMDWIN